MAKRIQVTFECEPGDCPHCDANDWKFASGLSDWDKQEGDPFVIIGCECLKCHNTTGFEYLYHDDRDWGYHDPEQEGGEG